MWDPPGPGIEPVSPALAGGLPTTAPPGKSQFFCLKSSVLEADTQRINGHLLPFLQNVILLTVISLCWPVVMYSDCNSYSQEE